MMNVIQFILADEAVVEEEVDKARKTVRARLASLGGARIERDTARIDERDTAHTVTSEGRPGRAAGDAQWKHGTPSEPGSVPKPIPKYMHEEPGPTPFPGLGPPVG